METSHLMRGCGRQPPADWIGWWDGGRGTVPMHRRCLVKRGDEWIVTIPFSGPTTGCANGEDKTRKIMTRGNSMAPQRGVVLLIAAVGAILFILFCLEGAANGPHPHHPIIATPEVAPFRARNAIVSNVQNDWYVHYALLLGYTIKKYNPDLASISAEMVLLIPREHDIHQANMDRLRELGWKMKFEDDVTAEGLNTLSPNWRRNLIKLRLWSWFEYRKILFLDADVMVLGDISLLLHDGFDFGAVPDTWPHSMPADNFNAGVLSLSPSAKIYNKLINITATMPVFPDADQGLLNHFFRKPTPGPIHPAEYTRTILPMKYNLNIEACNSHKDQWDDVWPDARVVHFTFPKPPGKDQCLPGTGCKFEQPMGRYREEYHEMLRRYGWPMDPI